MLKSDVDSCFQSVSNGKALLASTLTGLGVTTASDATFATINANITTLATNKYNEGVNAGKASVTVGGTASNANILKDKTITVNGTEKYKGTMPDNGATGASNLAAGESYTIPAGYTSGGTVTTKSLADQTVGTASAGDIISGKTAWVGGRQITGTLNTQNYYDNGYAAGIANSVSSFKIPELSIRNATTDSTDKTHTPGTLVLDVDGWNNMSIESITVSYSTSNDYYNANIKIIGIGAGGNEVELLKKANTKTVSNLTYDISSYAQISILIEGQGIGNTNGKLTNLVLTK